MEKKVDKSHKCDYDVVMSTKPVTQMIPVRVVRAELATHENLLLEKHLRKNGQKKGWFIRQAILEKLERESTKQPEKSHG